MPTLIIHGTADKTVPIDASGKAAAKVIANSTLIEYHGAPDNLFATGEERLTKDLRDFIRISAGGGFTPRFHWETENA